MANVKFIIGDVIIEAKLSRTPTAKKLLAALPVETLGGYWGGEFYFDVPVAAEEEPDATSIVESGAVAYWAAGKCLCLFWGPTPASRGGECRAASNVNIVGTVINKDDLPRLKARRVRVEAV